MLARVGFESITTEFRYDAQTNSAIMPWVQLALRSNILELLQFYLLFGVHVDYCLGQLSHLF